MSKRKRSETNEWTLCLHLEEGGHDSYPGFDFWVYIPIPPDKRDKIEKVVATWTSLKRAFDEASHQEKIHSDKLYKQNNNSLHFHETDAEYQTLKKNAYLAMKKLDAMTEQINYFGDHDRFSNVARLNDILIVKTMWSENFPRDDTYDENCLKRLMEFDDGDDDDDEKSAES